MACNNLGLFASGATSCFDTPTIPIYGDSINIAESLYYDSGCTIEITNVDYTNGVDFFNYKNGYGIFTLSACTTPSCPTTYCISSTNSYDGTYDIMSTTHNGYNYFTGNTSPTYYIYYNTGSTPSWCLSTVLDGPCLLFGKSPCLDNCPDLCDSFFTTGLCPTPTPSPTSVCNIDFNAVFNCAVSPTPTPTPSVTPTMTPTPTVTPTNPCGGISLTVSAITITPTPSPTPTMTPSSTPEITRPCNFDGIVTFNTVDDFIRCANSKRFKDCNNGFLYHTSSVILDEFGNLPTLGYVYRANINDNSVCVVYDGLVENISGVDNITILQNIGFESVGSCLTCVPIPSQTPTPTPSVTPTMTPTPSLLPCYDFLIVNSDPFSVYVYDYKDCYGQTQSVLVSPGKSVKICTSEIQTSTSVFIATQIGNCII
jgi:hypothetical protein